MNSDTKIDVADVSAVHCVGIGGIGVSAVARLFHQRGAAVSGSDMSHSPVTRGLEELGVTVTVGHDTSNVPKEVDLVIHTIAVPADNPEILTAKKAGIPVLTYPETHGLLSKNFYTVAVSGTHGKTTTTAMLAETLLAADQAPTVIVGSLLHEQQSNFIAGESDLLLVEACEYRRSFLQLEPDVLIVTNIDTDHLDYFDDLKDIQDAFRTLINKVPDNGSIICNPMDPKVAPAVTAASAEVVDFADIDLGGELEVPGEHNRQNGRAAVGAASKLEVSLATATETIRQFSGTWRRAQKKGELNGALIYDDYGHHPTEITSTLSGFRERFPNRRLVVAFQPHLYSRTKKLFDEFVSSFSDADEVIMLPIYAARETPDPDISADLLADELQAQGVSVQLASDFASAEDMLRELAGEDTLLVTQGAGDVYKIADALTTTK